MTVGMPTSSMARAISPTDRLHCPQAGVRKAKSTPSARNLAATSGALSSLRTRDQLGVDVAHEAKVSRPQTADDAHLRQIAKVIEGKDHVEILIGVT